MLTPSLHEVAAVISITFEDTNNMYGGTGYGVQSFITSSGII